MAPRKTKTGPKKNETGTENIETDTETGEGLAGSRSRTTSKTPATNFENPSSIGRKIYLRKFLETIGIPINSHTVSDYLT